MLPLPPLAFSGGSASAKYGPITGSPVVVNVAGFGSKANGTATSAAAPEVDEALTGQGFMAGGLPPWAMYAAAGVVLAALLLRRRK